ncbi:MAG: mechanosensitive ion channel [Campylobacter sp.]|nr:mechanosensitive ion channel [Campylobacter sp.]
MKKLLLIIAVIFVQISLADTNLTYLNDTNVNIDANLSKANDQNLTLIAVNDLQKQIISIDTSIKDNIWFLQYKNYLLFRELVIEKADLQERIAKAKKTEEKTSLENRLKITNEQLILLNEYENSPFDNLLSVSELPEYDRVKSPLGIIPGLSYIKQLLLYKDGYKDNISTLSQLVVKLKEKDELLKALHTYLPDDENLTKDIKFVKAGLEDLNGAKITGESTYLVYSTKIDDRIATVRADLKVQSKRIANIIIIVVFIILLSIFFKYIARKSIKDNERFYMANKVINFTNFFIIIFILLFAFIDNVSYIVTFLGFASAGLAIAMKDMFMSMLGWCVIVMGGSFRVGDRIRVRKINGEIYVGDILDISILRMTIYEDITRLTFTEHRRAGRIIFIPNNYIFTELISNYTHSGMKTVWDGIDILLTFDSNYKKATYIVKNISHQYSKGYTDIAKKQMNKLRSQYSIKNPSVEPRIFHFFEPYGIKISVWYMTNSYATLSLRSTISGEILEAFKKEDDIKIAYPTQTIYASDKIIQNSQKDEFITDMIDEESATNDELL